MMFKSYKRERKRIFSLFLAVALMLSSVAGIPLHTVKAAEATEDYVWEPSNFNEEGLTDDDEEKGILSDPIEIPISSFTASNALNGQGNNGTFANGTLTYGTGAFSNVYIRTNIPKAPDNYPNLHSLTFSYQGPDRVGNPTNPSDLGGYVRLLAVDNSQATGGWMGDDAFVDARTIGKVEITGATNEPVSATISVDKEKLASLGNVSRLVLYAHSDAKTNGVATSFTYSNISIVFAADCCDGKCTPCDCKESYGFCKFTAEGECCYIAPPATVDADCIEIGTADLKAVGATLNGGEVTLTAGYGNNFVYFDVTLPEGNTIYDYEGISFSLKGISGDNTYKILGLSAGTPKTPSGTFASYMPIANGVSNGFSQSTGTGGITFNFNDGPLQELHYAPTPIVRFAINMPAAVSNTSGTTVFEISDIKLNSKSCDYINPCETCKVPPLPGDNYTSSNGTERHAPEKYGYDYELWSQYGQGISVLNIPPADLQAGNGGIFNGTWKDTHNVLIRAGKKFTDNKGIKIGTDSTPGESYEEIGEMVLEFETEWETTDNVAYLGVYGWAFYAPGSEPVEVINGNNTTFSNQIEYYIIQDRKSYNPVGGLTPKGSAEINGIVYDFYVTNRINQPMLTGNGNFKQYWSVPRYAKDYRQEGTISVSEHFREWEKAGMLMDGPLYEVAWKVESYTGNAKGANGHAYVKKNILTINDVELSDDGEGTLSDPIEIPISTFVPSNALVGNGSFENGTVTYGEGDVGYARAYISTNIPDIPDNYPNLYSFTFSYQGPDRKPDPNHMVGGNVRLLAVTDSEATGDYIGGDSWIVDHTIGEVSITGATDVAKQATIEIDRKKLESLGNVTRLVLYVHSAIKTGGVSTSFTYSDISVVFAKDCCDGTCDPCDCVGYCKFDKEEGECCYVAPSVTTEADCIEIDTADLHAVGATVEDGVITLIEQYEGYFVYFDVELPEGNTIYDYESLSASFKGISGDTTYKPLKLSVGTPVDPAGSFASYTKIANEVANNLGIVTGTWSATFNFIDSSLKEFDSSLQELQNESKQVVRFALNMHSAAPTVFEISDIKLNSKSCNDDNPCSVCTLPPLPGDNYTTTGSDGRYAPTKYGYDYEIWSQRVGNPPLAPGSATMNIPLAEEQAGKGGIFNATWRNTHNLLIRAGKKFTNGQGIKIGTVSTKGESYAGIGEITIDFETDWATTDNVAYLGVYGWAFYKPGSEPAEQESGIATEFSNEIEYYIVQDRKSYNPVEFANKRGEAVIDGILYDFYVTDRIGQPMLNSDSGNFKQYWSMPHDTADFRQSGTVSVSEHFRAWEACGMLMDGPLYEVAWKVESYTGGYGAKGHANVTKNILKINGVEVKEADKPIGGDTPSGGSGDSPKPILPEPDTKETTNADGSTSTIYTTTGTDSSGNAKTETKEVVKDADGNVKNETVKTEIKDEKTGATVNAEVKKDGNGNVKESTMSVVTGVSEVVQKSANVASVELSIPVASMKEAVKSIDGKTNLVFEVPVKQLTELMKTNESKTIEFVVPLSKEITEDSKLSGGTVKVSKDILSSAKNLDKTIEGVIEEEGKDPYTWTFSSESLNASKRKVNDVVLSLEVQKADKTMAANSTVVEFQHSGYLPATAQVKTKANSKAGSTVYMYYMNEKTGKLEVQPNNKYKVDKEGFVTINVTHCSSYVLSTKKLTGSAAVSLKSQIAVSYNKKTSSINTTLSGALEKVSKLSKKNTDPAVNEVVFTYKSSDTKIAAVNKSGKVTPKKNGNVIITVTANLENGTKKTFKVPVKVKK